MLLIQRRPGLLVALSIVLYVGVTHLIFPHVNVRIGDSAVYTGFAASIMKRGVYESNPNTLDWWRSHDDLPPESFPGWERTAERPPLYPLLIGPACALPGGAWARWVLVTNNVLWVLAALGTRAALRRIPRVRQNADWAVPLVLLSPPALGLALYAYSDSLLAAVMAWLALAFDDARRARVTRTTGAPSRPLAARAPVVSRALVALSLGGACAAVVLTKGYMLPVALLVLALSGRAAIGGSAVFVLALAPWVLLNWRALHHVIITPAPYLGLNLWIANNPVVLDADLWTSRYKSILDWPWLPRAAEVAAIRDPFARDRLMVRLATDFIASDPLLFVSASVRKVSQLFEMNDWVSISFYGASPAWWDFGYSLAWRLPWHGGTLLALAGLPRILRAKRALASFVPWALFALVLFAACAVFHGENRYAAPFVLPIAGAIVVTWTLRVSARRARRRARGVPPRGAAVAAIDPDPARSR